MERPCRHSQAENLLIASLTGTASRHAGLKTKGGYSLAAAVADLHAFSDDPHLLAHATQSRRHWQYQTIKGILVAAGADPEEVQEMAEEMQARLDRFGFPVGKLPDQGDGG